MDSFEPSAFGPLGGIITLAVLFVLRELTSGVLKEAGKELWGWARKPALRAPPTSPCKSRSTRFGTTATTAGSCWHSGKEQEWVKPVGRLICKALKPAPAAAAASPFHPQAQTQTAHTARAHHSCAAIRPGTPLPLRWDSDSMDMSAAA